MANVFVLCTGRSGSVTFATACQFITNYSAGHESNVRELGSQRTEYPDKHIEVDNRLAFFLGNLDKKYGDDAIYVHLRRDADGVAKSYNKRWHVSESLITGWSTGIARQTSYGISASRFMVDTIEENIAHFLSDKSKKIEVRLETLKEDFLAFLDLIGAEGDRSAMIAALENKLNQSIVDVEEPVTDQNSQTFDTLNGIITIVHEQRKQIASARILDGKLQAKYERKQSKYEELGNKNEELKGKYEEFRNNYKDLRDKYEEFKNKNKYLEGEKKFLLKENSLLKTRLRRLRYPEKFVSLIYRVGRRILPRNIREDKNKLNSRSAIDPVLVDQVLNSEKPISSIDALVAKSAISLQNSGKLLSKVMTNRLHAAYGPAMQDDSKLKIPELSVLRDLYQREFRGNTYTPEELKTAWKLLSKSNYRATKLDENYFLLSAIRASSIDLVTILFDEAESLSPNRLPSVHKIGLLRLVNATQTSKYLEWRKKLELTPLEELKVVEIDIAAGRNVTSNHQTILNRFKRVAPAHLQDELEVDILPFYEKFEEQLVWIDCRLDDTKRREFIEEIKTRLAKKEPWSLIRLGDGESYAWKEKLEKGVLEMRERIWWGESLDPELRSNISQSMYQAIETADVLGIPSIFRFVRDTTQRLDSYANNRSISGLLKVLEGLQEMPKSERTFTEDRIHQVCFDIVTIRDIATSADKILIVSSVKEDLIKSVFSGMEDSIPVQVICVPTHSKTKQNENYELSSVSLPYVYRDIQVEIEKVVEPGTLVIIATGAIGKIFCEGARKNGGVAIDVGAMADYWIGVQTRSVADII